jgi:GT2 family glycosyltransferase
MQSNIFPLVSIITVNYNQTKVTLDLLKSLESVTYPNIEMIVVDNASKENPVEIIHQKFPEVITIRIEENLGFAGGNNEGIRIAKGEYFLFLNNDTEVAPDFLEPMIQFMAQNPETGMCSPKIRFFEPKDLIQYAGSTDIDYLRVASYTIGYGQKDIGQYDKTEFTHLIHGAAMLIPRQVVEKVGFMAEQFFLYYEELDWCERVKRAGYKVAYISASLVYHKESISVGKSSLLQIYYKTRNRILFVRRNLSGFQLFLALAYLYGIAAIKNLLKYLFRLQFNYFKIYWRAIFWHFKPHPTAFSNPTFENTQKIIFKDKI